MQEIKEQEQEYWRVCGIVVGGGQKGDRGGDANQERDQVDEEK